MYLRQVDRSGILPSMTVPPPNIDALQLAILLVAAFTAGASNAVAGGGSLLTFPALLAVGFTSKAANVTSTVALWPGHVGGSWAYRAELASQRGRLTLAVPSVLGGLTGSFILLSTPQRAFDVIVPFLILFACVLLAFQDRLAGAVQSIQASRGLQQPRILQSLPAGVADGPVEGPAGSGAMIEPAGHPWALYLATFLISVYGAYFGAGLGILFLSVFGILIPDDIHKTNALKGFLSLVINGVAVVYFGLWGPVAWLPAVVMACGAVAGGYFGVGLARRMGRRWLRVGAIGCGLVVAGVLFVRLLR